MTISNSQVIRWRKEYLQEMKNTLENAASIALFDDLYEKDTSDISDDERLFNEFLFKKQIPLIECLLFQDQNNPFQEDAIGEACGHHFPRYEMSEVFDFIAGMTNYGKYLVINQFPGDDKAFIALRDAVFANDKEAFLSIIEKQNVDFTAVRQKISASMFTVSGYGEMLQSFYDRIPNLIETESAGNMLADLNDFHEHMKGHLSKLGYDAASSMDYISSVLLDVGKEGMKIDEERLKLLTRFHFSDSEILGQFLANAFSFGIYSIILETTFSNPELDIVNKFLDDPKTNPMLNDIERFVYLISEGGLSPKKVFIPQPLRSEIEGGGIKRSLQEFNSLLAENEEPDDQEQQEPQPKVEPEGQKPGGERKPEEPKPYRFEWPSWEEFKEKTSIGIPKGFEFLTKLVDGIDINTKDGYEKFKKFLDVVADYGSIDDDANMMALIQFITGKCFDGASSKIRWEADNKMGRVLFFVVQWISDDDGKLGKTARMTDFKFSNPGNPDTGIDMDKISSTLQRAKGIDDNILDRLHACYAFIPGTKDDAQKRKS